MITRISLIVVTTLGLSVMGRARNGGVTPPIQIRAVLFDPTHTMVDLFIPEPSGTAVKLNLQPASLSKPQLTVPLNGMVLFYNTDAVNPEKPMENLAATLKVPQNVRRAIAILFPNPPGSKLAIRAMLIDDSAKGFPKGESRVVNLISAKVAVQAGEHKVGALPGKVTTIPPVEKRNEYNMAQTNFYFEEEDTWVPFSERQIKYVERVRRIYLIAPVRGGDYPYVTTIVDIASPNPAGNN
jgi:hypothetical protein